VVHRQREDDWFRKHERQLLEAAHLARERREKERAAKEKADERKRLKDLHFMKCSKCGHDMKEEDLGGVLIDRCSFCEGIYLDAGELDTLFLKRSASDRQGFLRKLLGIGGS